MVENKIRKRYVKVAEYEDYTISPILMWLLILAVQLCTIAGCFFAYSVVCKEIAGAILSMVYFILLPSVICYIGCTENKEEHFEEE